MTVQTTETASSTVATMLSLAGSDHPLWLRLLRCESEAAVSKIVRSEASMRDPSNWRPYGQSEHSWATISAQTSNAGKALSELVVNMMDAYLEGVCVANGVSSGKTPKDMDEAVRNLIPEFEGKILGENIPQAKLTEFAKRNLVLAMSGEEKLEGVPYSAPCVTFCDNGVGQDPSRFEKTFLSLSDGNKKMLAYVQGMFNMGSTAVFRFSGSCFYKLIISRSKLGGGKWGFTLVRMRPNHHDAKFPIIEYFLPDGAIPTFEADEVHPLKTYKDGIYEAFSLQSGTIVKIFDYQFGKADVEKFGLVGVLNDNLARLPLPIRILNMRVARDRKPKAHSPDRKVGIDSRTYTGMVLDLLKKRDEVEVLDEDENWRPEAGILHIKIAEATDPVLGRVVIRAALLPEKHPKWLSKDRNVNRIYHSVNGQIQYKQTRNTLSRLDFPQLMDRVVLIVDASQLHPATFSQIWRGDRDGIHDTTMGAAYKNFVENIIRNSKELAAYAQEVEREDLAKSATVQRSTVLTNLAKTNPTIRDLLSGRVPVVQKVVKKRDENLDTEGSSKKDKKERTATPYVGLPSPTSLEYKGKTPIEVPTSGRFELACKTDVVDDYLDRAENPGRVGISESIRDSFVVVEELSGGTLRLVLEAKPGLVKKGDVFRTRISLRDEVPNEAGTIPRVETCEIEMVAVDLIVPKEPAEKKAKAPKSKARGVLQDSVSEPAGGQFPTCILLTKGGRQVPGWTCEALSEEDKAEAGFAKGLGDNVTHYVVFENPWLQKRLQSVSKENDRNAMITRYVAAIQLSMIGYQNQIRALPESGALAEIDPDLLMRIAARGAASVALVMTEDLSKIGARTYA